MSNGFFFLGIFLILSSSVSSFSCFFSLDELLAEHLWELLVNFLLPAPSLYKTEKFIVLLLIPTIYL
jgi:hypothetical protein